MGKFTEELICNLLDVSYAFPHPEHIVSVRMNTKNIAIFLLFKHFTPI